MHLFVCYYYYYYFQKEAEMHLMLYMHLIFARGITINIICIIVRLTKMKV